ncbi:unnamed protein product [Darwinula stevensoni]|uniref:Uncharacterized protein n=1 Tax=Darwinula stevensoni TaxID=69355 RepID=A0A7R8X485_9CRUS|nr:unnamed protein product [Darwinula stevensoni]CAG0885766.1 unnamed protein product [Darwinula stevensoni]
MGKGAYTVLQQLLKNLNKTVVEAYTIGVVISFFDIVIVLQAFFLTLIVSIALTIYTLQSKKDLSQLGLFVFAGLCVLLGAGLLQLFLQSPGMEIVIAAAGAILFSLFIIYDTHMMMHKLSPEEYILATINLYLDIINLFLHILRFLNSRK